MKNGKETQRVTSQFIRDLYEKQDGLPACPTDKQWAGDGLLIIRRLGERSSQVFGSGEPFQLNSCTSVSSSAASKT